MHKNKETIGQFPGLFLFTGVARMMRPVINLAYGEVELIGTFEQVFLDIAISPDEIITGVIIPYLIYNKFNIQFLSFCVKF